jgi:uncharacterized protein (DUF2235 family)
LAKNILIFADGTGNQGGLLPDESRTNVYKLYRATRTGPESEIDPAKQIAFYITGIGTPTPGDTSKLHRLREVVQQAVGLGLTQKIIDCYVAILSVWRPGDRIHLFGFSRGAYIARCVAHVLAASGIPTTEANGEPLSLDPKRLRAVAKAAVGVLYRFGLTNDTRDKQDARANEFRRVHRSQDAAPYFVGVWDTVAAVGLTRFVTKNLYDEHLIPEIPFVRHAISIDEHRKDFARVKWGARIPPRKPGEAEPFQQIWFAGNHSDIGGSYPENESRLSDVTLKWMADFISTELPALGRVYLNDAFLRLFPSCDGLLHDECKRGVGGTRFHWSSTDRNVPHDAVLHETVYGRLKLGSVRNYDGYGKYRPAALRNHDLAKAYFVDDTAPPLQSRDGASAPASVST